LAAKVTLWENFWGIFFGDIGYRLLDAGTGFKLLVSSCWLPVTSWWLLAIIFLDSEDSIKKTMLS